MSNSQRSTTGSSQTMRTVFGIIMIIVYIGVGVLFLCGFFDVLFASMPWAKWVLGILLIIYGLWRGYRQFAGLDPEYGTGVRPADNDNTDDSTRK